jgi:hypothetical protein
MKKALKFTLIGLGVLFVLGIIGAALGGSDPNTNNILKTGESSSSSGSNSSGNAKSYVRLLEFSGNGTKKSSIFELHGNHARLRYKYKSGEAGMGVFSVFIAPDGEDLMKTGGVPEVMSTADHEESESAIQKSAGKYYLDVNATGNWSIIVEEEQ